MSALRCYGENSFTFLLFNELCRQQRVQDLLLTLHQAGTGERVAPAAVPPGEPQVWLFPNFGKNYGFGEPDALVLIGDDSFWFEIETRVDLGAGRGAAQRSILQIARYHFLHAALRHGGQTRLVGTPHLAIMGPTVSNSGAVKLGILRVSGHPVLRRIRKKLAHSRSHLVLMSIHKPKGSGQTDFDRDLGSLAAGTFSVLRQSLQAWASVQSYSRTLPETPPPEPVWYTYWHGLACAELFPNAAGSP